MIKQGTDFFKLTNEQARKLRKACKIAGLSFTAMAARPVDALKLIEDVQNRKPFCSSPMAALAGRDTSRGHFIGLERTTNKH